MKKAGDKYFYEFWETTPTDVKIIKIVFGLGLIISIVGYFLSF